MSDSGYVLPYAVDGGPPGQAFLDAILEIVRALNGAAATPIDLIAIPEPPTPPANHFIIFMDIADGKLKALGPNGTLTDIANP